MHPFVLGKTRLHSPSTMRIGRENLLLLPPMILAGIAFLVGINWGLPSRKADAFLFGDRPPWTGQQIVQLLGERGSPSIGADVDPNPNRARPVVVNDTDAKRAE